MFFYFDNILRNSVFFIAIILFFIINIYSYLNVYQGFNVIEYKILVVSERILIAEIISVFYFNFVLVYLVWNKILFNSYFINYITSESKY